MKAPADGEPAILDGSRGSESARWWREREVPFSVSPGTIALLAGAILWEVAARSVDALFFPPLSAAIFRLLEMIGDGTLLSHLARSMRNLAFGFGIALIAGIAIGLLMGAYWRINAALDIYVRALLTAPSLVFAPIFFALFGFSDVAIVAIIIQNTMFIIVLSTAAAVRSTPPELVQMARSFCASDLWVMRRVIVPSSIPLTMAGVRLATGKAVKGLIAGEVFIAVVGLGGILVSAGRLLDVETVMAMMIFVVLLSFAMLFVVDAADRKMTSWLPSTLRPH